MIFKREKANQRFHEQRSFTFLMLGNYLHFNFGTGLIPSKVNEILENLSLLQL